MHIYIRYTFTYIYIFTCLYCTIDIYIYLYIFFLHTPTHILYIQHQLVPAPLPRGKLVSRSERVMTVCTGSAIVASCGLLDGRKATTNKLAFDAWVGMKVVS